jgi:hypothetical protein
VLDVAWNRARGKDTMGKATPEAASGTAARCARMSLSVPVRDEYRAPSVSGSDGILTVVHKGSALTTLDDTLLSCDNRHG